MNLPTIRQMIVSTGFCSYDEIQNLSIMKAGMTNHSYSFCVNNRKYIMRIPGEGTAQLINRRAEYEVYSKINQLDISEEVHFFDPETGIKIASFIENSRPCDANDLGDIQICMNELRHFHNRKLCVSYQFDLWGQLEYYESLLEGQPSCHSDYRETKKAVFGMREFIEKNACERTLCHIDSVPDNFLFEKRGDDSVKVRLIDWEYAGMQDPHVDIAMFAVYSMYERKEVDRLIDAYFPEGCSCLTRMKIYCYIAVSGLLWSNWCEFKRKCGVEFGSYAQRQYDYAKEYTAYFYGEYGSHYKIT